MASSKERGSRGEGSEHSLEGFALGKLMRVKFGGDGVFDHTVIHMRATTLILYTRTHIVHTSIAEICVFVRLCFMA